MKCFIKKILAPLTGAVLILSLLAGCGAAAYDPIKEVMGYPGSTVLFTVNGEKVTAQDYLFWMAQNADYAANYYQQYTGSSEIPWTEDMGGQTMDEQIKSGAMETAKVYKLVESKAKELGYTFTSEDKAAYETKNADAVAQMGGQEAYDNWMKSMCITKDGMDKLSKVGTLYNHLEDGMSKEGGEFEKSGKNLATYIKDNDILRAKHILLLTKDVSTGKAYSAAEIAKQKKQAEDLARQLNESKDAVSLFDDLMYKHSQDPGLANNPDGYSFTAGEMVTPFENATRALSIGQISGVVESEDGFHIILRLDPAEDAKVQQNWKDAQMETVIQQWLDAAEVKTTSEYDQLTTADFYTKLTACRETWKAPQNGDAAANKDAANGNNAVTGEEQKTDKEATTGGDGATGNNEAAGKEATNDKKATTGGDAANAGDAGTGEKTTGTTGGDNAAAKGN